MKKLGILIALSLTSAIASAKTCDVNLSNAEGEVFDTISSTASATAEACNFATQDCENMIESDYDNDANMYCDAAASNNKLDIRSCTVRLTGPLGRYTLRRYTAYGFRACREALRRCERDSYRYRGFKRCLIEYRDNRRGRGDDRRRGGRRGGGRG